MRTLYWLKWIYLHNINLIKVHPLGLVKKDAISTRTVLSNTNFVIELLTEKIDLDSTIADLYWTCTEWTRPADENFWSWCDLLIKTNETRYILANHLFYKFLVVRRNPSMNTVKYDYAAFLNHCYYADDFHMYKWVNPILSITPWGTSKGEMLPIADRLSQI